MKPSALEELCSRLDAQAAILDIIGGETIEVELHRETATALRQAVIDIERPRSDAATLPHKKNIMAPVPG
jgi:hypothetical protein